MENSLLYALAGLLHDIGKFGQRADVSFDYSKELDTQSKNLAGHICNWSEKGYFTHQHVLWTNRFLETHKNLFEKVNLYGEGENNMFNLACYHHKPATLEHAIITMADHWSSGIDRNSDRVLGKNATYGRDSFRSVPFMSIFSELSTLKNPTGLTSGDFGYPLQPLSINEDIFPIPSAEINLKEAYPKLWQSFNEEVCKIDTKDAIAFIYTLFHLLKKYTWYIPASTMDYPNCSLFEHLKTTSAFSHCIHSYYTENKDAFSFSALNKLNLDSKHYPVKMVCGDISGIQSFIYNISNKSAMKGLKGRSFYVQLLTETISEELLQTCGASITNLIYAAGGKFYILVPNTSQVNDAIETYKQQIQEKLWDEYAGKITVHIASVDFSMQKEGEELKVCTPSITEKIHVGELWKLLAEKTSRQKKIKYNHIVSTRFDELFTPFGQGGDINVCAVTSEELSKSNAVNLELKYREQGESDDDVLVSKAVHKQIEIGSKLYDARYLVKHKGKTANNFEVGLSSYWSFSDDADHKHSVENWVNIQFDQSPELVLQRSTENNVGNGFKFYGGIPMASEKNRVLTLEDLCKIDHLTNQDSVEKLGVLRMDIDNLGQLFMHGFDAKGSSFSKLATLSALLDQFFSGYLNTIKRKEPYRQHINIVYSGGDDLFAVGRWDTIIDFAIEIRNEFRRFVCGREDISISGGIAIVGAKFPIAKAAEEAAIAESDAKEFELLVGNEKYTKNTLCLFGIPVHFELEIPFIVECKNDLVTWSGDIMSKGFLMKMFDYYQIYKDDKPDWQWQSAYSLARYAKEAKNNPQKMEVINYFKTLLFTKSYKNKYTNIRLDAFIVACRWAELELKQLKK